jgi:hypothetical protein
VIIRLNAVGWRSISTPSSRCVGIRDIRGSDRVDDDELEDEDVEALDVVRAIGSVSSILFSSSVEFVGKRSGLALRSAFSINLSAASISQ